MWALSRVSDRFVEAGLKSDYEAQALVGSRPKFDGAFEFVEQLRANGIDVENTIREPNSEQTSSF